MSSLVEVSACVLRHQGMILISRRPVGSHLAGLWEFPGGKRQAGETWEAAAIREMREELAIDIKIESELLRSTHAYPEKTVELRFFACSFAAGPQEPQALGVSEFVWVTPKELPEYDFPPADQPMLELLQG